MRPEMSLKMEDASNPPEKSVKVEEATKTPEKSLIMADVMKLLSSLWELKEVKVATKYTCLGALLTATTTLFGGLVGGPAGVAVGSAVGGLAGAWMSWGKFKPVPQILMELPPAEQEKLLSQVMAIVSHLQWADIMDLIKKVKDSPALQEQLWVPLKDCLKKLGVIVQYGD